MAKLPSMQFYPGDWMKDPNLRRSSAAARGVWMDVLCIMFEHEPRGMLAEIEARIVESNPFNDPQKLLNSEGEFCISRFNNLCNDFEPWTVQDLAGTIAGVDSRTASKYINELINNNVIKQLDNGIMYSSRLLRDEYIRSVRKKSGKDGGEKSQANRKQTVKQKSTPSSSSSSSTSVYINSSVENALIEIKQNYPKRAGSNPWGDAEAQIKARIKTTLKGITKKAEKEAMIDKAILAMKNGAERYRAYCDAEELTETRTVMQAKRFFGKNKEFLEDWKPSKKTERQIQQSIRYPRRDDGNAWVAFAKKYKVKTKPGESQFDFERRVREAVDKQNNQQG